jgi:hypothetical protein
MDFWVILYSLVCVVIGGGAVNFLFKRGQTMGAIGVLVLLVAIFIFFGLRWFPGGSLNGSKPKAQSWPPIVNMCPDFMVSWTDTTTRKVYCYDANNVYGLQTAASSPPMTSSLRIGTATGQSGYLIMDPLQNSAKRPTNLASDSATAPYWPLAKMLSTTSSNVLTPIAKYMRWEGVWDGGILKADKIPLPA